MIVVMMLITVKYELKMSSKAMKFSIEVLLTFAMSLECPKIFEAGGDFIKLSADIRAELAS